MDILSHMTLLHHWKLLFTTIASTRSHMVILLMESLLLYTFINGNVTICWRHTAIHDVTVYYHHYYYYMDNNYFRYDVLSSTLHLWLSMHICTVMNCQVTLQDDFTIRYEHSSSDTYIDWISSFPSYEHEHSQLFTPNMNLIHLHCRIWNHEYISRRIWTLIYLHIYSPTTGIFHKLHLFADYWTVSRTILYDVSTSFRRSLTGNHPILVLNSYNNLQILQISSLVHRIVSWLVAVYGLRWFRVTVIVVLVV